MLRCKNIFFCLAAVQQATFCDGEPAVESKARHDFTFAKIKWKKKMLNQTLRHRAFSKIHQSAIGIVCVCLSIVCKTSMFYIILKLRF